MQTNNYQSHIDKTYEIYNKAGAVTAYNGYGKDQASIDPAKMPQLPMGKIYCPEVISKSLGSVLAQTMQQNKEIPFFIFAHDGRDYGCENDIYFDQIVFAEDDLNLQQTVAHYGDQMCSALKKVCDDHKNDPSLILIQGHSHPSIYNDNNQIENQFSVADIANVSYLNEAFGCQMGACLVTPNRKLNTAFYDKVTNNFYSCSDWQITNNLPHNKAVFLPPKEKIK